MLFAFYCEQSQKLLRDKMIKRDKRNIGKRVKYIGKSKIWYGRELIVKSFRGDHSPGSPFVSCWDIKGGGIYPFPGHTLIAINKSTK